LSVSFLMILLCASSTAIWLLVKPGAGQVLFAMSSNRKTIDLEKEFVRHQANLAELLSNAHGEAP